MPRERDVGGNFTVAQPGGLPFVEAIEYARSRNAELAADYYGHAIQAHRAKATTITGAASVDQIQQVMDEMNAAIAQGLTFADWKRTAATESLLLPGHRLDNIFRTNVQAAYNRGRYQQQVASKTRPMWMYDAVNDSRTRPSHLAMDNVILPRDDPWWTTHYPPNGYRCRCTVLALTEKQATARGGVTDAIPPDATPDPGWDYNPGADYSSPDASILTAAPGASPRAVQALAGVGASAASARLSYADLYKAGGDSLAADIDAAGGTWARGVGTPVAGTAWDATISEAQGTQVHALFLEKLAKAAAGASHTFNVVAKGGGIDPKALIAPIQRFFDMLPQAWQKRIADALKFRPLTVEDGLKKNGKHIRGYFSQSKVHLVSPHNKPGTIIHESAHALQYLAPDIDGYFQAHHLERTAGDRLESLLERNPGWSYSPKEVTRPDQYFNDYVGREYLRASEESASVYAIRRRADTDGFHGRAMELMSMTFEGAFTDELTFLNLLRSDPRLLSVLYGLLFHYRA